MVKKEEIFCDNLGNESAKSMTFEIVDKCRFPGQ